VQKVKYLVTEVVNKNIKNPISPIKPIDLVEKATENNLRHQTRCKTEILRLSHHEEKLLDILYAAPIDVLVKRTEAELAKSKLAKDKWLDVMNSSSVHTQAIHQGIQDHFKSGFSTEELFGDVVMARYFISTLIEVIEINNEQVIYEDIFDNDLADVNESVGAITISGLTEGLAYEVTYKGYRAVETITQDEVDGQVDKLYVLCQYTFISFVPLNLNPRPQDQDLELDYDDIPLYDKTGFYSDSTRQSFVVDNNTGLIYKIEGINIASLSGGCVAVQENPFPFDMRINEQNELEFYSIFQNASINTYSCLKDKFDNIFIQNDLLNYFDGTNNVTYYVLNDTFRKGYFFNQNKEVYMMDLSLNEIKLFVARGQSRDLNNFDSFYVFEENHENGLYEVENGVLKHFYQNQIFGGPSFFGKNYLKYGTDNGYSYEFDLISEKSQSMFLTKFGKDYDIILELSNGNLYSYKNIWESFDDYFSQFKSDSFVEEDIWLRNLTENSFFTKNEILNSVSLNNSNEIIKITPNEALNYEFIPEFINNEWTITPYVYGTYFAPPSITVTLQPINRG
jgi:hypothetical protein